jgi:hypothetical protein
MKMIRESDLSSIKDGIDTDLRNSLHREGEKECTCKTTTRQSLSN